MLKEHVYDEFFNKEPKHMNKLPNESWPFGHDNENFRGKLTTRTGDAFPVEASMKYDSNTDLISWGIETGRHPDWLDTLTHMETVLKNNGVHLSRRIHVWDFWRCDFIKHHSGCYIAYRCLPGPVYVLGTPDNNWLVNNFNDTYPAPTQSIPLRVLRKILIPLKEFLLEEYNITS